MRFLSLVFIILSFSIFAQDTLDICSFNIQFLGHFKERKNEILADILKGFDIVVVEEMVAAPVDGKYPDGTTYTKDPESAAFVSEMKKHGFSYWMSTEDTGPTKNHTPLTASEWWITFYKPAAVQPDSARCYGFVSQPLAKNPTYQRVPYAFPFRSVKGKSNFTLIPVHLNPGDANEDKAIRQKELEGLATWSLSQIESNKDFIILGDCNFENGDELQWFYMQHPEFALMNKDMLSTNTKMYESESKGRPYDHVIYTLTSEVSNFKVLDLMKALKPYEQTLSFSLTPYNHDLFRTSFSDHVPVSFQIITGKDSDL